jgi:hypothetical protein
MGLLNSDWRAIIKAIQYAQNNLVEGRAVIDVAALNILDDGIGDNQADIIDVRRENLASGASNNHDVRGGVKTPLGRTGQTIAKVKLLLIYSLPTNTTVLTVGNAASPLQLGFQAATHRWNIPPAGWFFVTNPVAGWPSTADTNDLLLIANAAGAAADYDFIMAGTKT